MNFTIPDAITGVAGLMRERIGPEVGDNYTANMTRMAASLLTITANWVDDAAAIRVAENARLRAVLGEAANLLGDALAARLREAAKSVDPGLRISELDGENNRLRLLLIEVHTELEMRSDEAARATCQHIWRLLEEIELQRAPRE